MKKNSASKIDEDSIVQLELLSQIGNSLHKAGIKFWLRGGWAVDFLLGRLTRPHSDIDLIAWKEDAPQIHRLLVRAGFLFIRNMGVQYDFSKNGQMISIVFICQERDRLYVEGIPDWVWLPDALSCPPQQLAGLVCHIISAEQLLKEKEDYQKGTGQPPRPKDLQSMVTLRQIISAGD